MPSSENVPTLFRDVRIFDGRSAELSPGSDVLVRGTTIESISTQPIEVDRDEAHAEIDGVGRVLMPGLIDAHWHAHAGLDATHRDDDRRHRVPQHPRR